MKDKDIINLSLEVSTHIPRFSKGALLDLLSLWEERKINTKWQGLPFDISKKRAVIQTSLSGWRC
jgi:hypothetical protein